MLSIVVPVYNGEANLAVLVERIKTALAGFENQWELLFIDDGSTDGSLPVMKKLCGTNSAVGWISFQYNAGQQAAVLCGLRHSRGDYTVTMDDDLQHPPEIIPRLIEELSGGYDAAYAVPDSGLRGGSRFRDLFFTIFLGKPAGLKIGSFRILSRKAVDAICVSARPSVYISAELFNLKMRVTSFTYKYAAEPTGVSASRYSFVSRFKLYMNLILRYTPPFRSRDYSAAQQYRIASKGGCL